MAKNLIIVESPAKTRTLKKFLGRDWAVEASVGHIRDLPKKDMGLGPGFEPTYAVLATKKDVVKKLKDAAKKAKHIYLAPTPTARARRSPGTSPRCWATSRARCTASPSTRSPRARS